MQKCHSSAELQCSVDYSEVKASVWTGGTITVTNNSVNILLAWEYCLKIGLKKFEPFRLERYEARCFSGLLFESNTNTRGHRPSLFSVMCVPEQAN